jgi:hypothetical protein
MTKPADDKLGHAKREIKALTGQLKQERARMTELKEAATDLLNDCINFDERNLTDGILTTLSNCLKSKGLSSAWLLRQKADAVEAARDEICTYMYGVELLNTADPEELTDFAKRLRQAADDADGGS